MLGSLGDTLVGVGSVIAALASMVAALQAHRGKRVADRTEKRIVANGAQSAITTEAVVHLAKLAESTAKIATRLADETQAARVERMNGL